MLYTEDYGERAEDMVCPLAMHIVERIVPFFRLDALALSVIATATWLGGWVAGWVAGCHTPVLYQNG